MKESLNTAAKRMEKGGFVHIRHGVPGQPIDDAPDGVRIPGSEGRSEAGKLFVGLELGREEGASNHVGSVPAKRDVPSSTTRSVQRGSSASRGAMALMSRQ